MEALFITRNAALEKLSNSDLSPEPGPAANAEMWKWIIAAAGMGMLGRAGLGMMHMMQPKSKLDPTPTSQQVSMALPEKDEKIAGVGADTLDWLQGLTAGAFNGKGYWSGSEADTAQGVPNLYALGLPAAALAGIGGWKAVDTVADHRDQAEGTNELERAKLEYQKLLQETMAKHSADEQGIEAELDELADMVEGQDKQAGTLGEYTGPPAGTLAAYAILSALASGKLSYDYFRKRNQKDIAEDALRRRAKERTGGVSPIYMAPTTEGV